jgi:hypothetical protein
MSEASVSPQRTPWHFWVIAVVALLWNGFGAYDYIMSQTAGDAYLTSMGMTAPQIDYLKAMPAWMTGVWALGVWGAMAGAVLMLLRSRWAVAAFAASLVGLLISLFYTHVLSNGYEVMGQQSVIMNAVITAGALFFVWYSRRMAKQGVLR